MLHFGATLPTIRERVNEHIALPGLPREKVLATIVRLLETTFIRIGNESYARENNSFGLTTLRRRHVDIRGSRLTFKFKGKSGVEHTINLTDRRLARIVKTCRDIPGYELFEYLDDDGNPRTIDSTDVNAYLDSITNPDDHFTAKDFRTWAGTVLAAMTLRDFEPCDSSTQLKKNTVEAIKAVAHRLGNTPSVCRKCYIHPAVPRRLPNRRHAHPSRQPNTLHHHPPPRPPPRRVRPPPPPGTTTLPSRRLALTLTPAIALSFARAFLSVIPSENLLLLFLPPPPPPCQLPLPVCPTAHNKIRAHLLRRRAHLPRLDPAPASASRGVGFAVSRFGLFLRDFSSTQHAPAPTSTTHSVITGVVLVALGVLINISAVINHITIVKKLSAGTQRPGQPPRTAIALAVILALLGTGMAVYLLRFR